MLLAHIEPDGEHQEPPHHTGFAYDNAGNLTFDGLYNYTWDGENHLKSANGVNYTYDGDLRRVEKSNGKLYWYSTSGQTLEETDLSGNLISDYVYFAGQADGRRDASGAAVDAERQLA